MLEWEDKAKEWQSEVEKWVLGDKAVMDLAKKACGSHIRAYATHVVTGKGMFNHNTLHYGHLAKSFGIRAVFPTGQAGQASVKPGPACPNSLGSSLARACRPG